MDYSCRDIPMRLDIKYQPLNFDIYLSQLIEIPTNSSLDQEPYNFKLEHEALKFVDKIISRIQKEDEERLAKLNETNNTSEVQAEIIPSAGTSDHNSFSTETTINNNDNSGSNQESKDQKIVDPIIHTIPIAPSCPKETPLTPIKSTVFPSNIKEENSHKPQINPREFEDMHYNPFDHLELQTIDELRELNLVFQASYANQNTAVLPEVAPSNDNLSTTSSPPFPEAKQTISPSTATTKTAAASHVSKNTT